MWYGVHIGFTRDESLSMPFSELLDYVAIEQIKIEGAQQKKTREQEVQEFFDLLKMG